MRGTHRSVKDGKRDGYNPEDDEDLHCLISADTEDRLQKGVAGTACAQTHARLRALPLTACILALPCNAMRCDAAVLRVIEIAKSVPEELNDRKRQQLRELAALNGCVSQGGAQRSGRELTVAIGLPCPSPPTQHSARRREHGVPQLWPAGPPAA